MSSLKEQRTKIKERAAQGGRKRMRVQPVADSDFMLFCSRCSLFIGNPPKADKANTGSFSVGLRTLVISFVNNAIV